MRLILLALLLVAGPAGAKPVACLTSIGGQDVPLMYDTADGMVRENRSYRERLFGRLGRITCPGYVTLREMTPDLTDEERALFCLQYDRDQRTYPGFVVGERAGYVGCRTPSKSFCQHVNATAETATGIARRGGEMVAGAVGAGVRAERHLSGAVVMTGSGASLLEVLGAAGAEAAAALSSPAILTAAAATVVTVGGAVYVCGG